MAFPIVMQQDLNSPPKTEEKDSLPPNFDRQIAKLISNFVFQLSKECRERARLHIGFALLFSSEILALLLFFSFFTQSSIVAFSVGFIFLTLFSYLSLRLYFQAKKPEQQLLLRNYYLEECKKLIPYKSHQQAYTLSLSDCIYSLVSHLYLLEYRIHSVKNSNETLSTLMQKLSGYLHWNDLMKMRELLLFVAVKENIQLVKANPIDLQAHASLANAYRMVAQNYMNPAKQSQVQELPWISKEYLSPEMNKKFKKASLRAIEEYKILDKFSPKDVWIHEQMAAIYRDLERSDEEMHEYELICHLTPKNPAALFKLGALYFEQGHNAKGLQIYEQLRRFQDPQAEILIGLYHALSSEEYSDHLY